MILVVGSINMDIVFQVPHIPNPGETVLSGGAVKSPGGKGANQAVAAAKLGGEVVMLGCVGRDGNGRALTASMERSGVHTEPLLLTDTADTSCAYICVAASGENAIVVDSSANMQVTPAYLDAHEELFAQAEYCVLQLEIPVETVKRAMALSRKHGVKILLNPSPLSSFSEELLEGVDYLIPNEGEAAHLMGVDTVETLTAEDWQRFMKDHGIGHVILTVGPRGAYHYASSGDWAYYPTQEQKAVDTTGAGDTFLGAFAAALSEGKTHGEAISFANRASGIAVTRPGAQSAMPTKEELQ